jgi:hypothetical protein
MTEVVDSPIQGRFDENIIPPHEPLLPFKLITSNLWMQMPAGNIAFADASHNPEIPESVQMLDQKGEHVKQKGQNLVKPFVDIHKTPGFVVKLPETVNDESYDELLTAAVDKITRGADRDETRRIIVQHSGVLVTIEPKPEGRNLGIGWKKDRHVRNGCVREDVQVIEDKDKIITIGRIDRMRSPQDRTSSYGYKTAQNRLDTAQQSGLTIDRTALNNDAKSTRNVARTEANLSDLNGIIIKDGLCSFQTSIRGLVSEIHKCDNPSEHEFKIPKTQEQIDRLLINQFKENKLKDIELPDSCGDCGQHYVNRYQTWEFDDEKTGKTVSLLYEQKGCRGHRGRGFLPLGKGRKVGYLGSHPIGVAN